MRRTIVIGILWAAMELPATTTKTSIIGSQHDLSPTGGGPVKSAVADACMFCHAPHNVSSVTPLWDHTLSTQTYSTYVSTTYSSGLQTPNGGSSKLCLSCHDGTVAPGMTIAQGLIATSGSMTTTDVFGANLRPSHPVSMVPLDDGSLASSLFASPPATRDGVIKLDGGKVECITCHDPHEPSRDTVVPKFLIRSNANSAICMACHDPTRAQPNFLNGWTTGSHATATNTVPTTAAFGAYGTVAANACSNCHGAHNNAVAPRSLKALEGAACAPCHGGANASPALLNVMGEFSKAYAHPTLTVTGAHDPSESIPVSTTRHAACADCHNPHAAYAQTGTPAAPLAAASLAGVNGYDSTGVQRPATNQYQLCYKCHADSPNKPATSIYGRTATRYPAGLMPAAYPIQPPVPADPYNLRLKFNGTIGHNLTGSNIVTTSNTTLRPYMLNIDLVTNNFNRPLTTSSVIYCTDCHNSDQARSSNGAGPNGPHGSAFPHLLQFNLFQSALGGGGSAAANGYDMCNKCHTVSALSGAEHAVQHITSGCTTCHDPHGVIGGNVGANRGMMNFDTGVMAPSTTYFGYFYLGAGTGQKGCYTTCHGFNHNPLTY